MRKEAASKLEKILEKLLTSKLKELNTPENFDRVKIDIYPTDYGISCHISYLIKKPFIFKLPIGFNQNSTDGFISYKNIFSDKLYDNFIISYLLILDYNVN